jgi:phospholipase C
MLPNSTTVAAAVFSALLATSLVGTGPEPPAAATTAPFGFKAGSTESVANLKDKIKHVVWVLLENRSFDNILGGVNRKGLDNPVNNGIVCNPVNLTNNPTGASQCNVAKDFDSVANDPDHSVTGNAFQFYGSFSPDNEAIQNGTLVATNQGFVQKQLISYPTITPDIAGRQVMGFYSEDQVPTLVDLVDEFTTFNSWFSCIPGVSSSINCFHVPY